MDKIELCLKPECCPVLIKGDRWALYEKTSEGLVYIGDVDGFLG